MFCDVDISDQIVQHAQSYMIHLQKIVPKHKLVMVHFIVCMQYALMVFDRKDDLVAFNALIKKIDVCPLQIAISSLEVGRALDWKLVSLPVLHVSEFLPQLVELQWELACTWM